MRNGFPLFRLLLSLVLIVVFLLGGTLRYTVFRMENKPLPALEKVQGTIKTHQKLGTTPDVQALGVSPLKFQHLVCYLIRHYQLLVFPIRIVSFGYPVFRDHYFARIFSHFIAINAP